MSEIYRKYFKIETGAAVALAKTMQDTNKAARARFFEICADMGAEKSYSFDDHSRTVLGFDFQKEPDRSIFKKVKTGFYPKKGSKIGAAFCKQIDAVQTATEAPIFDALGLPSDRFAWIHLGAKFYWPSLVVIPSESPTVYVVVPWFDIDPARLAEYKASGDKGDLAMRLGNWECLLWEPTSDMSPVKEWEVSKACDEWNNRDKNDE